MRSDPALHDLVARRRREVQDFASLSATCHGAWPALLSAILRDVGDEDCRRLLASARGRKPKVMIDPRLPLAHPLDADWRFTRESAGWVLDHALDATPADGILLLVAMPTVALAAFDRGLGSRIAVAARHGDATDKALRAAMPGVLFQDLAKAPSRPFDTVAIDPPWYDEIAMPMMATAMGAAEPGAAVFICVPDRFTLPSAAPRLGALARRPRSVGFEDGVAIGPVRYATPFFELRCLQVHGITNVDPAWRTGILLRCRPGRGVGPVPDARPGRPLEPSAWIETTFGGIRLWKRANPRPSGAGIVAVAGSVSAGDPMRASAWLWTSGNLAAAGGAPLTSAGGTPDDFPGCIADDGLREGILAALAAEAAEVAESVEHQIG